MRVDLPMFWVIAAGESRQVSVAHVFQILMYSDFGRVIAVDRHLLQSDKEPAHF